MRRIMKLTVMTCLLLSLAVAPAYAGGGHDKPGHHGWGYKGSHRVTLNDVRRATNRYHRVSKVIKDGFVPFSINEGEEITCFDSPTAGGMGVHYVKGIDGVVDARHPEAMVYQLSKSGKKKLVAVEYIVPQEFVEDADGNVVSLPRLFGHDFHKHSFLPVYILHAWIWKWNPAGTFADFNPRVPACP
jgi:hypothetical protein